MIKQIDHFLPFPMFEQLRRRADELEYTGVRNPVDGAVYPGISLGIPEDIQGEVVEELSWQHSVPLECIKVKGMFLRLSVAGTPTHERVHSDVAMGQFTLVHYLNRARDCKGGTDVVRHVTGFEHTPRTKEDYTAYINSQDVREDWEIVHSCKMKPNRAFIVDSDLLHCAEPAGGFGKDAIDGRLVLVAFYEVK